MFTLINLLRVLVAAVAAMAIGFIWYLPRPPFFGLRWGSLVKRWVGLTDEQMMANQGQRIVAWLATAIVNAFILAYFLDLLAPGGLLDGIVIGIVLWFGLGLTFSAWPVIFANQPLGVWAINNGAYLLMQVVMAAILTAWRG